MLMDLIAKNEVGFVDGSITRPTFDHLLFNVWNCCNNMVNSQILNVVYREITDSLLYIDNAYEIWIDLRDRFHQSNGPQIFQIILIIT